MTVNQGCIDQLINSFIICCQSEGKSPRTTEWYLANLKRFSRFLKEHDFPQSIHDIGPNEARQFIFHLQNNVKRWEDSPFIKDSSHLSPLSVHGYARTIKVFWSWLWAEGYISQNPMARLRMPKTPQKLSPTLSREQVQRLLDSLDRKTTEGYRNHTIILLLFDTGIRLSELTGLRLECVDFAQSFLTVNGKGSRERTVPFGNQVRRALWRYIANFRPEPEFQQFHQVFLSSQGIPLKPRSIQSMLKRLGKRAGISEVRCSPHIFRHSFAKHYLLSGGDVFSLQRILGHSSLEVVKLYINLASSDISDQHRRFSPVDNMRMIKRADDLRSTGSGYRNNGSYYRRCNSSRR